MEWLKRKESWHPQHEDARDAGDIDYGRVIHSASFRRLQGKTQILNLGDSDFYRTRLTHSLEVAQIAGGISKQLEKTYRGHSAVAHLPDRSMIQAIGCSHDLGHPPFGHGGEVALNYCMRGAGGFEGNGQTLRILARLESFSAGAGANLTRRTLLGLLKYPVPFSLANNTACMPSLCEGPSTIKIIDAATSKPPKCYLDSESNIVDWLLGPLSVDDRSRFTEFDKNSDKHHKSKHKSLDCSIMDVADDIAYGVHDLEDAIALQLISKDRFREVITETIAASFLDSIKEKYPNESGNDVHSLMVDELFRNSDSRKHWISRLVHHFVVAVGFNEDKNFSEPLLRYRVSMAQPQLKFLKALKNLVSDDVIRSPEVQHLEFKGQTMVVAVFEAILTDPERLLPRNTYRSYANSGSDIREICDFVAGMTDTYLLKTYDRLFSPRMGSVFDRL